MSDMSGEIFKPLDEEARFTKTPGLFTKQLFEDTKTFLELSKRALVVAQVKPQEVKRWGMSSHPAFLQIKKGLILHSDRNDFGLVLGDRGNTLYDRVRPSFEFGIVSHRGLNFEDTIDRFDPFGKDKTREEKVLYYLNAIVHQTRGGTYGSASFQAERGTIEIDCFVDERAFGGSGVSNMEYGRLLSEEGLDASLGIIRELTKRAWR